MVYVHIEIACRRVADLPGGGADVITNKDVVSLFGSSEKQT